jgi:exopolysaccharide biosynthesis polyprenyl glycosylphosphotransferase
MLLSKRQLLLNCAQIFDSLVMIVSFGFAGCVAHLEIDPLSFAEFLSVRIEIINFLIFILIAAVWNLIFVWLGIYHSHRFAKPGSELFDILKATSCGTIFIFFAARLFDLQVITAVFLLVFWLITTLVLASSRSILRVILMQVRLRGRNMRHMLLVGANSRALRFVKGIEGRPDLGYQIIGFVDENWSGAAEVQKLGYSIVTDYDNFADYLRRQIVDEVVICLPVNSYYTQAAKMAAMCEEQGVIVRFLPDIFNSIISHSTIDYFEGEPIIFHHSGSLEAGQIYAKRLLDILLGAAGLVFLFPLFLFAAILIKVASPGPIFYVQERIGLNKRRFCLYKFRTMRVDAEKKQKDLEALNEADGPVFKIRNDPRIFPAGRFLRRFSIDELPQIINVIKGDMSIVGPRPLPVRDYNGFSQDWHRRRFTMRPGLTCTWQVCGRSNTSFEQWMQLDMEYIARWSLWLDLKIILQTVPAVLFARGAV